MEAKIIKIRYTREGVTPMEKYSNGDWIDLRAGVDMALTKGELALIPLGVAMQLPEGYEALVAPRSSSARKFNILQANSIGIIDETYCGDNDEWMLSVLPLENTMIHKNDRICQFRIIEHQPPLVFDAVEHLNNEDRGGFGSTGTK